MLMNISAYPFPNVRTGFLCLIAASMLAGCFESPSAPSDPLSQTSQAYFPKGITQIAASFEETATQNWNDGKNWHVNVFRNGEEVPYAERQALINQYIPGITTPYPISTEVMLNSGTTCVVNQKVQIHDLILMNHTHLMIPKDVVVENSGLLKTLGPTKASLTGGGIYRQTDAPKSTTTVGDITRIQLHTFYAPKAVLGGCDEFEVHRALVGWLSAKNITVHERLDVEGFYRYADIKDDPEGNYDVTNVHIKHLNICSPSKGRDFSLFALSNIDKPVQIGRLSFEPGSRVSFSASTIDAYKPVQLMGTLDITNIMFERPEFIPYTAEVGAKAPILIARDGFVGDPATLLDYRRRCVLNYFDESTKWRRGQAFPIGYEGNTVYAQKIAHFLLASESDRLWHPNNYYWSFFEYPQLRLYQYADIRAYLTVPDEDWKKVGYVLKMIDQNRKTIYEGASDVGIDRLMGILLTPNPKDRFKMVLDLVDVSAYMEEGAENADTGNNAVLDVLTQVESSLHQAASPYIRAYPAVNMSHPQRYGFGVQTETYRMIGALQMSAPPSNECFAMRLNGYSQWEGSYFGVLQLETHGLWHRTLRNTLGLGIGYQWRPHLSVTGLMGWTHAGGGVLPSLPKDKAQFTTGYQTYHGGLQLQWQQQQHALRMEVYAQYTPLQSVALYVADLGLEFPEYMLESSWWGSGRVGYAYIAQNGLSVLGVISMSFGNSALVSGRLSVTVER